MAEKRYEIRSLDGKPVCEAVFKDAEWVITIDDDGCNTTLHLYADGEMIITGYTTRN